MTEDLLGQIALVLLVCVGLGFAAMGLRLPLLVGLLFAGVLVGPEALGIVAANEQIELLGEIGISLLLFVVGLKLDPRLVRTLGPVVLAAGTIQVAVTAALAYAIAVGFGLEPISGLYLAAGMAFSSTVVVIKLLTDRGTSEQLPGRIAIGILIVQDIIVVALMVVLASLDPDSGVSLVRQSALVMLRGVALLAGVGLLARYVLPVAVHLVARRGELLVLASVTWAVGLAALAHLFGFSAEVGAFIAGVALASSDYRDAISGRLATLRDFLLVFFFIDLGTQLRFEGLDDLGVIAALSAFVLLGKPLLIAVIATLLGFHRRVAIESSLTLAQISEFSLILASLGVTLGHIDGRAVGIVAAVALVTITASTFLSGHSDALNPLLSRPLEPLQREQLRRELEERSTIEPTVIVLGLGRLGRQVVVELTSRGERVLGIDFDPQRIQHSDLDVPVAFGDLEDPELPTQLPLSSARWVVSTARDPEADRTLVTALRRRGFRGGIAVAIEHLDQRPPIEAAGADLVLPIFHVAAGPLLEEVHTFDHEPALPPHTIE
ncbi:MAG: cation:proton antiporter [Actinomycetota bacterium]